MKYILFFVVIMCSSIGAAFAGDIQPKVSDEEAESDSKTVKDHRKVVIFLKNKCDTLAEVSWPERAGEPVVFKFGPNIEPVNFSKCIEDTIEKHPYEKNSGKFRLTYEVLAVSFREKLDESGEGFVFARISDEERSRDRKDVDRHRKFVERISHNCDGPNQYSWPKKIGDPVVFYFEQADQKEAFKFNECLVRAMTQVTYPYSVKDPRPFRFSYEIARKF